MAKFTSETARAAAAKRRERAAAAGADIAPTSTTPADEPRVPASMHGGLPPVERASVVVSAPPPPPAASEEPAAAEPGSSETSPAPAAELVATPFTPEVVKMFTNIVFDTVGVVTGKPHIWKLDEDELDPLAPAIGHQLSRIPIVRAIGPDNTELVICVTGIGVIVTKRLNEHADEVQREKAEKARRLAAGAATSSSDVGTRSSPAESSGPAQDFASEAPATLHIGMRAH